jgi:Tol biopolymer transport system component
MLIMGSGTNTRARVTTAAWDRVRVIVAVVCLAAVATAVVVHVPAGLAATAPAVSITSHPAGDSSSADAVFAFSVDDPLAQLACSLDRTDWSPCASPVTYTGLSDGLHLFNVRATDAAGNASTASFSWTIAAPAGPASLLRGTRLAFVSTRDGNGEIYVTDGSTQTRLTTNAVDDDEPDVSPDGTKIAFQRGLPPYVDTDVWIMNADGTTQIQLTSSGENYSPTFSPDGSKIAFESTRDGNSELYVMNANGSSQTRLTTTLTLDEGEPTWSPAGVIAYQSGGSYSAGTQIFTIAAGGGSPTQLTSLGNNYSPAYSPDGSKIAFESTRDGNSELYVMNANGSSQTRLTNSAVAESEPSWSPDGAAIAYYGGSSTYYGSDQISVIPSSGGTPSKLTSGADNRVPSWFPLAQPSTPPSGGGSPGSGGGGGSGGSTGGGGALPDLTVTGGASPAGAHVGDDIALVLTTSNLGGGSATGVQLAVVLPAGFELSSAVTDRGPGCLLASTTLTCKLDFLPPQLHGTVTVRGRITAHGPLTFAATISSGQTDAVPSNNTTMIIYAVADDTGSQPGGGDEPPATIVGTPGNDVLIGTAADEVFVGGGGNDRILGGGGNDVIDGGTGNDILIGGAGRDHLIGGPGNDRIAGGTGNDVIDGGAGNDRVDGGAGNDRIVAGSGNDIVDGGAGDDHLLGGAGQDHLRGGTGHDQMFGGVGRDVIEARDGRGDSVNGGPGFDTARFDRHLDAVVAVEKFLP